MKLYRGDIIVAPVYDERGLKRDIDHPQVVIQDTLINQSRVESIVVCGLSTNIKRAFVPGNILLNEGEGNLPKRVSLLFLKSQQLRSWILKKF